MTDYTSRLHYFTWWGEDNEQLGLVRQVVRDGAPFSAIQTVNINYMSAHPEYYKQLKLHPEFIPVIRSQEQETNGRMFRYIPKSRLNGSPKELADVHTGDIISIITNKDGLDTSHVGIVFWQFVSFKPVMAAQALACGLPLDRVSDYPVIYEHQNVFWILCLLLAGVYLSILIHSVLSALVQRICRLIPLQGRA